MSKNIYLHIQFTLTRDAEKLNNFEVQLIGEAFTKDLMKLFEKYDLKPLSTGDDNDDD